MNRIALVHDYFIQEGGAERVAEELYKALPDPDVYATVALPNRVPSGLAEAKISTSWMQALPRMAKLHRYYFPLYPLGVAALNLCDYDLVISSSSGYAKGVKTRSASAHVCYCHTPMRWIWRYKDYAEREQFGPLNRMLVPMMLNGLKRWDQCAARQPDQFIANSRAVAERIWDVYKRDAVVIPPPINVGRFQLSSGKDDYYLVLSRLVGYKRIDLAIAACKLLNRRLIIIGDGPDRKRLQAQAGPSVQFLGRLSDKDVEQYVSRCRALLFPGEEDFGMVPLEVAAAGIPTIAYRAGGALETIVEGVTGVLFDKPDPNSLADAMEDMDRISWSPNTIRKHASGFDNGVFRQRFRDLLDSLGLAIDLTVKRTAELENSRSARIA